MKTLNVRKKERKKAVIITVLFAAAMLIAALGAYYTLYSMINGVAIPVGGSNVPGFVFGMLAMYLGIRYILLVKKLKPELYKSSSRFAWGNFKVLLPGKKVKNR